MERHLLISESFERAVSSFHAAEENLRVRSMLEFTGAVDRLTESVREFGQHVYRFEEATSRLNQGGLYGR